VFLKGPSDAARTVLAASPGRVLYCGRSNGSFIFSVRSLSDHSRITVIRGDKLPSEIFLPEHFEDFAHEYGIEQIVLERNDAERRRWDDLFSKPSPSMELVSEIPMVSSEPVLNGKLRVYRFTRPSPTPKHEVTLRMMNGAELKTGL
jgi:hypothetical protein